MLHTVTFTNYTQFKFRSRTKTIIYYFAFYPVAWGYQSNTEMFKGFFGLLSVNSIYPCSRKPNIFFFTIKLNIHMETAKLL